MYLGSVSRMISFSGRTKNFQREGDKRERYEHPIGIDLHRQRREWKEEYRESDLWLKVFQETEENEDKIKENRQGEEDIVTREESFFSYSDSEEDEIGMPSLGPNSYKDESLGSTLDWGKGGSSVKKEHLIDWTFFMETSIPPIFIIIAMIVLRLSGRISIFITSTSIFINLGILGLSLALAFEKDKDFIPFSKKIISSFVSFLRKPEF